MATRSAFVDRWEENYPHWSDWTPVQDGWERRRPKVDRHFPRFGVRIHINPPTSLSFDSIPGVIRKDTATEEVQFRWKVRNPIRIKSRDRDAGCDERDSEKSRTAPSELDSKHSNIAPNHEAKGQPHRASSAIISEKSALTSFAVSVASTSDNPVTTSSSAAEKATAIATWIFGTITAGVGIGTMRATQKTADAGTRSAVAGESSALSSRKSAAAAEESARAATKSAQAAENAVAVMQKQLEVMIQDRRGSPPAGNSSIGPPAGNSGSGTGSLEATIPGAEISREQQTAQSVSTATPPALGAALTSAPADAPQERVPIGGSSEQMDPAQTTEATQPATSKGRAVPIKTTPSVRTSTPSSAMMTTGDISLPQAPTSDPGEPFVKRNPTEQVPSIRTSAVTLPKETVRRKEGCQDELKSRQEERERMVVLERRLQELRNRFA